MKRWGYSNLSEEEIKEIVRRLVWDYPAHEFVIDLHEAQAIGLNAQPMGDELEDLAWSVVEKHRPFFQLVPGPSSSTGGAPSASMVVREAKTASASSPDGGSDA
jgi:hypothetical protein